MGEEALLRQRMEALESAVARVSATKQALRENAAGLKQEIRDCFGAQLGLLRGREAQLLASLEAVATCKEEILAEQQDQLHQALGAARQTLDCLSLDGSSAAAADTLRRLAAVPLRPRETAAIGFTADGPALRRLLHSFGRITSTARRPQDRDSAAGNCLPPDSEDYEDEETSSGLWHKALSRPPSSASWARLPSQRRDSLSDEALWTKALTSTLPRPSLDAPLSRTLSDRRKDPTAPDQLGHWLSHIKHQTEPEPTVFEDFHLLQSIESGFRLPPPANQAWMVPRETGTEQAPPFLLPLWGEKAAWLAAESATAATDNGGRDEAMEEALGWSAVLESVHAKGDLHWLARP